MRLRDRWHLTTDLDNYSQIPCRFDRMGNGFGISTPWEKPKRMRKKIEPTSETSVKTDRLFRFGLRWDCKETLYHVHPTKARRYPQFTKIHGSMDLSRFYLSFPRDLTCADLHCIVPGYFCSLCTMACVGRYPVLLHRPR